MHSAKRNAPGLYSAMRAESSEMVPPRRSQPRGLLTYTRFTFNRTSRLPFRDALTIRPHCKKPIKQPLTLLNERARPVFIWRKRVEQAWLDSHALELGRRFPQLVAVIRQPHATLSLIEIYCFKKSEGKSLLQQFGGTIENLPANWFQRLAKQPPTKPLRIGSRLLVSRTKGPNTIVIPAEAAFGTGDHATTAMCLRMLERVTRDWSPGWSMLDAGTGSGILAIAGSRFGAARVVAIENDPLACSIAQRNARANRAPNIEFRTGDVLKQKPRGKFDIITANLFSEILICALPMWLPRLGRDGWLILSGVLRSQERSLVSALRRNGCHAAEIKRRGKWIALLASQARKRS